MGAVPDVGGMKALPWRAVTAPPDPAAACTIFAAPCRCGRAAGWAAAFSTPSASAATCGGQEGLAGLHVRRRPGLPHLLDGHGLEQLGRDPRPDPEASGAWFRPRC